MPVVINDQRLTQVITGIQQKLESPDLIVALAKSMSGHLVDAFGTSGLQSDSGATVSALSKIGEPEKTATGWAIGVGDGDAVGSENTPAPRGTLRAFYNYLAESGRVWRYTDWWGMSRANKRLLANARRAGLFGGRGADYANYMWVQNAGNAKAGVRAHHFIEAGLQAWRQDAPDIIRKHLSR